MFNQTVKTPLGEGTDQGNYGVTDELKNVVAVHRLVRFKLTDEIAAHLSDSNCPTPRAKFSALFHFPTSEVGEVNLEYAIVLGLIVAVVWFGIRMLGG